MRFERIHMVDVDLGMRADKENSGDGNKSGRGWIQHAAHLLC